MPRKPSIFSIITKVELICNIILVSDMQCNDLILYTWQTIITVSLLNIHHLVCVYLVTQSCLTLLWPHGLACQPPLWDLSGKNTGVGCLFLLQGIFIIQGSNSHLLRLMHWQVDSLSLSHPGYSCLENPMDRGAWCAAVHGVAKSQTQLSD